LSRIAAPAAIAAALLLCGCGPKAITVGSRPFPAEKPVFTDASGTERMDLPAATEPLRLVLLDYPWCPACGDAWGAVRQAGGTLPPGSVRVYRILFDREVLLTPQGRQGVPPLVSLAPSPSGGPEPSPATITLAALPGAFAKEFRVRQVPVLLLLDRDGTVIRRWNGFSRELAAELSEEVRKRSSAPSPLPPGR